MFYKILHQLPPVPQHLIDQVDQEFLPPENSVEYLVQRNLSNWAGYNGKAAQNRAIDPTLEFSNWVTSNISDSFSKLRLNYVDCTGNRLHTGAHTDGMRYWTLLWNIRTGGESAQLCFYQENGKPIERELKLQSEDRSKLTVIHSIAGPANCWYLINSLVLHGVENLTETRINFQIGFTSLPDHL